MPRFDEIFFDVLDNIDDAGLRDVNPDKVFRQLERIQVDIAQRGLAIQGTATITTVANQDGYNLPTGTFHIKQIFEPPDWTKDIAIVHDVEVWREKIRDTSLDTTQPLFCTVWNGQFILHPEPTVVVDIPLWTYNLPITAPAEGGTPEVDEQWDSALEFGATWRLLEKARQKKPDTPQGNWLQLYEAEIDKYLNQELKAAIKGSLRHRHSSEDLGF